MYRSTHSIQHNDRWHYWSRMVLDLNDGVFWSWIINNIHPLLMLALAVQAGTIAKCKANANHCRQWPIHQNGDAMGYMFIWRIHQQKALMFSHDCKYNVILGANFLAMTGIGILYRALELLTNLTSGRTCAQTSWWMHFSRNTHSRVC